MIAAVCSSRLPMHEILLLQKKFNSAGGKGRLALVDGKMKVSKRVLAAAEKLAVDASRAGVAISDKMEMEFLLWLAQTAHVKNAIEKAGAKNSGKFIAVMVGEGKKEELQEAMKALKAKVSGTIAKTSPDDFEEIEKMALGRISG